jgi:putative cell wall-binding protein/GH43 family beta-xylosidase
MQRRTRWRRTSALGLALAVALAGATPPSATAAGVQATNRISGPDRYATAAALSARGFPDGADQVVVASGTDFPDALGASPVAAERDGPLLLTRPESVPSATMDELRRLAPTQILLAGGPRAVSPAVETALSEEWPVTRVGGDDRYETAVEFAEGTFTPGVPVAFVVSGRAFPDALSAGAAAGRLGGPVLLVTPEHVPAPVLAALDRLDPGHIYVVGGPAVIGEQVMTELAGRAVTRLFGPDRYATAAALLDLVPGPATTGVVATGALYADGLAAGPAAAALDATFALAGPTCLYAPAAERFTDGGVEELLVVGGPGVLSDTAVTPCPSATRPALADEREASGDAPDPTILHTDSAWYAYSTETFFTHLPVRSSADLVAWGPVTDAMPALASWVRPGRNWAPAVVEADGTYVAWYTAHEDASGRQCVSRAVSTAPMGPFVDDLDEPALCQRALGGSIDPDVFTDNDGSRWLLWKSDENAVGGLSRLWIAELSPDARTITGNPTILLEQSAAWENPTIEQPSIVRQGFTYFLFYSGGWWESSGYGIGYATATSLSGPYTKQTSTGPWLGSSSGASGPGALDTFVGPGGELWATYHAWPGAVGYDPQGGIRTMRVARLEL